MGSLGKVKLIFVFFGFLFLGLTHIQAQTYEVVLYYPTNGFEDVTGAGIGGIERVGQARLSGQSFPEDGHALLWLGNSPVPIDLHPTGTTWEFSEAFDTDGMRQVGYVKRRNGTMIVQNAVIWNGSANDYITLSTSFSAAVAIGGDQQVGFISSGLSCSECGPTGGIYAVLWRGTPESAVLLNPVGRSWSRVAVYDTDGFQQVGSGTNESFPRSPDNLTKRALLWFGTRESVVDLTPNGYRNASAVAVRNGTQVGTAIRLGEERFRAIVWHGSAANFSDLGLGILEDTNGTTHVGFGSGNNETEAHAFRWDGDSGARFDLHTLLPPGLFRHSFARAINENGDIIGYGQTQDYTSVGILWRRTDLSNNSPTVSLISPTGSVTYSQGRMMSLEAEAVDSDGSVTSVEFYADGELIGTSSGSGNKLFQLNWMPEIAGTYRLQAKAIDNSGGVSVSRPVLIRVIRNRNSRLK